MSRIASLIAVSMAAVSVSACAVLTTPDPVQTYRFGAQPVFQSSAANAVCEPQTVVMRRVDFAEASRSDRLLAVTGSETAYIGGARWISQAQGLFQSSLEDAIVAGAPCVRLSSGLARDGMVLSIDVRRFETVYSNKDAVPEVKVVVHAELTRGGDRALVGNARVDVSENAGSNRVSSIVSAYERANAEAIRQLVEWLSADVAAEAARTNS